METAANTGSTKMLPAEPDLLAPDGSQVRVLLSLTGGSMAHFRLNPGQASHAVRHRSVEEIWYVLSGEGEMWRSRDKAALTTPLSSATCLTIPVGVSFQFRCTGDEPLAIVAVTMPPWPGDGEAETVEGTWRVTI